MAVVRRRRKSSGTSSTAITPEESPEWAALAIFGLIIVAGALAFGSVDRIVQAGVLVLLAVGLLLRPPEVLPLSRRGNTLLLTVAGVLILKELLPAVLFGSTGWRSTLQEHYGLVLPWTHHPEPGRALEGWMTAVVAGVWFLWVRTLAGPRANRTILAWTLFGAAAVVAGVSFRTRGMDTEAIYGMRYSPGWQGFGPFPNRNHTASLLAMGTLMGCGCLVWASFKQKWMLFFLGLGALALTLAGLLATQSRGGFLALAVGGLLFMGLVLAKMRSRRTLAAMITATLLSITLALAVGGPVLKRFSSGQNNSRREIWRDAATMWGDAPLFGHGLNSFTAIFPMYQTVKVDNQQVIHPESSWWQWLTELGLLPVTAGIVGLGWLVGRHLRLAFTRHHGFFLAAGGLSATGVLLAHCLVDVPAHRWGTAGFALAALAVAAPLLRRLPGAESEWNLHGPIWPLADRRAALVPLAVALYFAAPFKLGWPEWSPSTLAVVTQDPKAHLPEWQRAIRWFPLDSSLHQLIGQELLQEAPQGGRGARSSIWRCGWRQVRGRCRCCRAA